MSRTSTPGQRLLVIGAAGGVGHFAVQLGKHRDAIVVGVCSGGNAEFVRSLGADAVIDYASEDFTARKDRFDVIFDAACASTFSASRQVLAPAGIYINTAGSFGAVVEVVRNGILARLTSRQRAVAFALKAGEALWQRLARLAETGALKPHLERTVSLEEVPAALRDMEAGHGRGKIVVLIPE